MTLTPEQTTSAPEKFVLPLLSAVVIGRNEGERLRLCLQSVAAMNHADFDVEVIYVDSGSTDGSVALAESLGFRTVSLRPEHPSAALGRNAGWRAASGAMILFLDGDTILHPDFVASSLQNFSNDQIAVVWGHRRELYPDRSIYNRVLDLDWVYAPGLVAYCGGDALFRRSVLESTGGFDDTLIAGEEPELCRRIAALGLLILHVDHPMTGHDLAITHWGQYWKRSSRAGHAFAEVAERFKDAEYPFWTVETAKNRRQVLILLGIPCFGIAASTITGSPVPFILTILLLLLLALRSAWKARWKTNDKVGLLLYGVHSHLQQIPILSGQLRFKRNLRRGKHAKLVEYKRS
jgi:cellulose synthase/poly-beta-1,6-N-acetylglucosamine synthase-like glycosyltransferase